MYQYIAENIEDLFNESSKEKYQVGRENYFFFLWLHFKSNFLFFGRFFFELPVLFSTFLLAVLIFLVDL